MSPPIPGSHGQNSRIPNYDPTGPQGGFGILAPLSVVDASMRGGQPRLTPSQLPQQQQYQYQYQNAAAEQYRQWGAQMAPNQSTSQIPSESGGLAAPAGSISQHHWPLPAHLPLASTPASEPSAMIQVQPQLDTHPYVLLASPSGPPVRTEMFASTGTLARMVQMPLRQRQDRMQLHQQSQTQQQQPRQPLVWPPALSLSNPAPSPRQSPSLTSPESPSPQRSSIDAVQPVASAVSSVVTAPNEDPIQRPLLPGIGPTAQSSTTQAANIERDAFLSSGSQLIVTIGDNSFRLDPQTVPDRAYLNDYGWGSDGTMPITIGGEQRAMHVLLLVRFPNGEPISPPAVTESRASTHSATPTETAPTPASAGSMPPPEIDPKATGTKKGKARERGVELDELADTDKHEDPEARHTQKRKKPSKRKISTPGPSRPKPATESTSKPAPDQSMPSATYPSSPIDTTNSQLNSALISVSGGPVIANPGPVPKRGRASKARGRGSRGGSGGGSGRGSARP